MEKHIKLKMGESKMKNMGYKNFSFQRFFEKLG